MDVKEIGGAWTEERHSAYLSSLEELFVQRMRGRRIAGHAKIDFEFRPPLNRALPDSATESNRDHIKKRKEKDAFILKN